VVLANTSARLTSKQRDECYHRREGYCRNLDESLYCGELCYGMGYEEDRNRSVLKSMVPAGMPNEFFSREYIQRWIGDISILYVCNLGTISNSTVVATLGSLANTLSGIC
jgi:hypothetical protein